MAENDIECPKCGYKILIDEVLKHRLNNQVNNEVVKRLELEKQKIETELKNKYLGEQSDELKLAQEKLKFETEKRAEAQKRELEFIKNQNELEDKLKNQEVEIARRLHEEKKIIEERVQKESEEKQNSVVMELRKQLEDTKKSLTDAQRKAQQGSMQTQGEVMELALYEMLEKKFPGDIIEDVAKGINGADIIQKVVAANGEIAGVIAWESKQTKAWVEEWVSKLKDDGHKVKANIMVLATNVLPKGINHFGEYRGVWVVEHSSLVGLASALRSNLLSIYSVALANVNSQDKAQILYKHLTSQNFINQVQSVSETYIIMTVSLEKEKTAMQNIWNVRQKQIERLSSNTRQLFSEIGAIAGGQFAGIEILEELAAENIDDTDNDKTPKKLKKVDDNAQTNLF